MAPFTIFCPVRGLYPLVKPVVLDTHHRVVPWRVIACFYRNGCSDTDHEPEETSSLSSSSLDVPLHRDYYPLQVTFHTTPAMSFDDMGEFRHMARLAFGIDDPRTLGWECRHIPPAQNRAEEEVIFRSNEHGSWIVRKPANPFEVRFG